MTEATIKGLDKIAGLLQKARAGDPGAMQHLKRLSTDLKNEAAKLADEAELIDSLIGLFEVADLAVIK